MLRAGPAGRPGGVARLHPAVGGAADRVRVRRRRLRRGGGRLGARPGARRRRRRRPRGLADGARPGPRSRARRASRSRPPRCVLAWGGALAQVLVIAGGALVGWRLLRVRAARRRRGRRSTSACRAASPSRPSASRPGCWPCCRWRAGRPTATPSRCPPTCTSPARWCSAAATWCCRCCTSARSRRAGSPRPTSWPATAPRRRFPGRCSRSPATSAPSASRRRTASPAAASRSSRSSSPGCCWWSAPPRSGPRCGRARGRPRRSPASTRRWSGCCSRRSAGHWSPRRSPTPATWPWPWRGRPAGRRARAAVGGGRGVCGGGAAAGLTGGPRPRILSACPQHPSATERHGAVLEIVLDRPPVNAIDQSLADALYAAFTGFRDDPGLATAVLIGGGHRAFSAGWDLEWVRGLVDRGIGGDDLVGNAGRLWAAFTELLDPLGLTWIEDPLPDDALAGLPRLAASLSTPICTGERLAGIDAFTRLIDGGGLGFCHIDVAWCGGVTTVHEVAALATPEGCRSRSMTSRVLSRSRRASTWARPSRVRSSWSSRGSRRGTPRSARPSRRCRPSRRSARARDGAHARRPRGATRRRLL